MNKNYYILGLAFLLGVSHSGNTVVRAAEFDILVKDIHYGPTHSIIEDTEGQFYALGGSDQYALLGRDQSLNTPTNRTSVLSLQSGESIVQYDVGYNFNIFLTSNGRVLTSGRNDAGQIGDGTIQEFWGVENPVDITNQFNLDNTANETITKVVASFYNPVVVNAISSEGRVFTWGSNPTAEDVEADVDNYAFAVGKNLSGLTDVESIRIPLDLDISDTFPELNVGEKIVDIEYFDVGGIALTSEGSLYSWGVNTNGLLGRGEVDVNVVGLPARVPGLSDLFQDGEFIVHMEESYGQIVLLTNQNRLIGWGKNELKQLLESNDAVLTAPVVLDLSGVDFAENEIILDYFIADYGVYFVTTAGQIWMRGYSVISSLANYSTDRFNEYRANKTWLNVTSEMPVLPEGEIVEEITGYGASFLFFTNTRKLITQYYFGTPNMLKLGRVMQNVTTGQYDNAVYKVFIDDETEPRVVVESGLTFQLPKLDAEEGFYHSGWGYEPGGISFFNVDHTFTMSYGSHFRLYAIYTEGEDPNASSEPVSSETTTSTTSSSTSSTVTSSIPDGSEPETSEPSNPRPSPVLPILLGVGGTVAIGGGVYYFGIQKGAIGGFSLVTLKQWFIALFKRKKDDDEDDDKTSKK